MSLSASLHIYKDTKCGTCRYEPPALTTGVDSFCSIRIGELVLMVHSSETARGLADQLMTAAEALEPLAGLGEPEPESPSGVTVS